MASFARALRPALGAVMLCQALGVVAAGMPAALEDAIKADVPMRSAKELFLEYTANEIAADQKYKGSRLIVGGMIAKIALDLGGDPYVLLEVPGSAEAVVRLGFPKTAIKGLSTLAAGQSAMFLCSGEGMSAWAVRVSCWQEWALLLDSAGPNGGK